MRIRVNLFGDLKDYLPGHSVRSNFWIEVDVGTTIQEALNDLKVPLDIEVATVVNGRVHQPAHVLRDGDELLIIPPISGG